MLELAGFRARDDVHRQCVPRPEPGLSLGTKHFIFFAAYCTADFLMRLDTFSLNLTGSLTGLVVGASIL